MNIRTYLQQGHILIFDGAMGTYFASLSDPSFTHCELANLTDPDLILSIHEAYVKAGAQAIKTNTFAANRFSLECSKDQVQKVIESAYRLAHQAVNGTSVFIFANIGPIPETGQVDMKKEYCEIADLFLSLGAKNFLFETFSEANYLQDVAAYIKEKNPNAFILVEFAVAPDGYSRQGELGTNLYETMNACSWIDGVGFNCVSGPSHLLRYFKQLKKNTKPLCIMPNAGYPTVVNQRTYFDSDPKYFAKQMKQMVEAGVQIIGGCCGTTPEFIAETVKEVQMQLPQMEILHSIFPLPKDAATQNLNPVLQKLKSGQKIIAVEVDPPLDANIDFFMESAKRLSALKVDLITIADCPIARARVDSSILACKLKRELGIESLPHMTCRDRNINATKALLLGLSIEGIQNVLVVTGDPVPTAERNEVKSVFNFNSSVLASFIQSLNDTVLPQPFLVYGALNINAKHFHLEIKRAQTKIKHGIQAFLTQPALSETAVENVKTAKEVLGVPILGGILPIVSHRNACFMNNEISGITVSEEIVKKYVGLDREAAEQLAIEISLEMIEKMALYVDGYYLITPFKRIGLITEIISRIQKKGQIFSNQ